MNLEDEWFEAWYRANREDYLDLERARIPRGVIKHMIGIERVAISDGLYEPLECGSWAYITPVRYDDSWTPRVLCDYPYAVMGESLVDLVCWEVAAPDSWALRTGDAEWLGCVVRDEPTTIRRNPLSWLRHRCDGLVMLTADKIRRWQLLQDCNRIVAEDDVHADELSLALNYPYPKPPIYL